MRGPYRKRLVQLPPRFKNFKPSGIPRKSISHIILTFDEYEAIRLADYNGEEHLQASEMMKISRPTFTRLIEKARRKLATAIIEGLELVIEGGHVDVLNELYLCNNCSREQAHRMTDPKKKCFNCGSSDLRNL